MTNPKPNQPSTPPPTTRPLSPSSDPSATTGRTSSMPDEKRYTARLRRIRDRVPSPRSPLIFTGASCSKMNQRLSRLAPPKGTTLIKPKNTALAKQKNTKPPGYYGGDSRKYEKRTKRYLDGKNVKVKNGGAPVFSGSSATIYDTRMMRLQDRH